MLACLNMVYECFCNSLEVSVKVFLHKYSVDRQAYYCSAMAELMDVRFKELLLGNNCCQ